jgi:hypothetical protein
MIARCEWCGSARSCRCPAIGTLLSGVGVPVATPAGETGTYHAAERIVRASTGTLYRARLWQQGGAIHTGNLRLWSPL